LPQLSIISNESIDSAVEINANRSSYITECYGLAEAAYRNYIPSKFACLSRCRTSRFTHRIFIWIDHSRLGNNVPGETLVVSLHHSNLQGSAKFLSAFKAVSDIPTSILIDRARAFSHANGGSAIAAGLTDDSRQTRRWAICTGAGASAETLAEATHNGVDTLIVGEGAHWTAVDASERGIAIIYLGHYASETLGVYALADDLSREFSPGERKDRLANWSLITLAEPGPVSSALELRGISKRFGNLQALSNVSLVLRPGTVHALLGENGPVRAR
jgi:hypothetical protein